MQTSEAYANQAEEILDFVNSPARAKYSLEHLDLLIKQAQVYAQLSTTAAIKESKSVAYPELQDLNTEKWVNPPDAKD